MSDLADYLDNLAAQGIALTEDVTLTSPTPFTGRVPPEGAGGGPAFNGVQFGDGPPKSVYIYGYTGPIPYGLEIAPRELKPEWLLPGDIHIAFSARVPGLKRCGQLHFDSHGKLCLDGKRMHGGATDFVTLYPAPGQFSGNKPLTPNPGA